MWAGLRVRVGRAGPVSSDTRLRGAWFRSGALSRRRGFRLRRARPRRRGRRSLLELAEQGLGHVAQRIDVLRQRGGRFGLPRARFGVGFGELDRLVRGGRSRPRRHCDRLDRPGPAQLRVGLAHRSKVFNDKVGDALRVGNGLAAGDETEIELIEIALHGDVERASVVGNRNREIVRGRRTDAIHRLPRSRHVRDDRIEEWPEVVRRARPRPQSRETHDDERRAEDRDVRRHQVAHVGEQVLRLLAGGLSRGEPRQRLGDVGRQAGEGEHDLVVELRVAERPQRRRHAGCQRFFRQRRVFGEIAAQSAGAERQHDVVDRRAPRLAERLDFGSGSDEVA